MGCGRNLAFRWTYTDVVSDVLESLTCFAQDAFNPDAESASSTGLAPSAPHLTSQSLLRERP